MHIVQTVEALKTETCFTQLALLPGMSVHTMDLYTRIAICVCACIYMPVVARVHIWLCTSSNLSTFSPSSSLTKTQILPHSTLVHQRRLYIRPSGKTGGPEDRVDTKWAHLEASAITTGEFR
jgi:hypothetical protein